MSMEQAEPEERSTGSEESLLDRMVPNGDDTLRRAEGRVQGAESKAAELEAELASMRAANVRMEEQLKRLWGQLGMPTEGPGSSKSPIAPRRARQAQTEQPALDGHTSAWADETALEPPPVASEGPDYSAHGEEEAEPGEALGAHETRYLANSHVSVGVPALQEGTVPGPEEPLEEPHQRSEQAWAMPGAPGPDEPTVQAGGPAGDLTAGSASEELARVLVAAEQAAARIVDVAQARAKGELAEIDRRARAVQAEADRLSTWQQQVERVVQAFASQIQDLRASVEQVPERIELVLSPLAEGIPSLVLHMEELRTALRPPPLSTRSESSRGPAFLGDGDGDSD